MIRSGDYSIKLESAVKFPFVVDHYMHSDEAEVIAYVHATLNKFVQYAIEQEDTVFIQKLIERGAFDKKSVAKYAKAAEKAGQATIKDMLETAKQSM